MRRAELLKTDLISEVILLAVGVLVFVILLLILVVALTQPSALALSAPNPGSTLDQVPVGAYAARGEAFNLGHGYR